MRNNYICALDIGSSKIAAALATRSKGRIINIFFDTEPSKGIRQGVIVDSIELVNSISRLMKNIKAKSGLNVKFVYANISGQDILTKHSRACLALAERGNKVITISDMRKVNEQARILGSSLEEEIVHIMPYSYTIDSKTNVSNPLGLYSHKLEVDLYMVAARLSSIQNLARVINQSGYEIKDLFFSGLATSKTVLGKESKNGINLFCDIGSDMTELLMFKEGGLADVSILPFGGDNLTRSLCEELKIPFDLAEDIKRSHGCIGDVESIQEDKEILVRKSNLYKPIKQNLVTRVITDSAKSICLNIKEPALKKVAAYEINNFFVVGRSVLLEGFIEMLENTLKVPVKLGRITNPDIPLSIKEESLLSGQNYLMYLTSLGIICQALQGKISESLPSYSVPKNPLVRAINRFREIYQEYF